MKAKPNNSFLSILYPHPNNENHLVNQVYIPEANMIINIVYDRDGQCLTDFRDEK